MVKCMFTFKLVATIIKVMAEVITKVKVMAVRLVMAVIRVHFFITLIEKFFILINI